MKWAILLPGLLALVLLQTSALPAFHLFGVGPNLLLVLLCCWAVVRLPEESMVLTPAAGLGIGLLSFQGIAVSVAAFAPVVPLACARDRLGVGSEYLWALAVVAAATILHFLAVAAGLAVEGARIAWLDVSVDILVPSLLGNLLLALPAYWLIRLPTPRPVPGAR